MAVEKLRLENEQLRAIQPLPGSASAIVAHRPLKGPPDEIVIHKGTAVGPTSIPFHFEIPLTYRDPAPRPPEPKKSFVWPPGHFWWNAALAVANTVGCVVAWRMGDSTRLGISVFLTLFAALSAGLAWHCREWHAAESALDRRRRW